MKQIVVSTLVIASCMATIHSPVGGMRKPLRMAPKIKQELKETNADRQPPAFNFTTKLDHFDAQGHSSEFNIRYLVEDTYWNKETGPILFYAGNEGDIYGFYDNSGFITKTIAEETGALVIFGEHRYFGESYPYDPAVAFTPEHNIYLTVEQAMMDYVLLIKFIRESYAMEDKACIVFGGSYGGMLAGWLRQKYPATFQGALSASGPSVYFKDAPSAPEMEYSEIAT